MTTLNSYLGKKQRKGRLPMFEAQGLLGYEPRDRARLP